MKIIKASVYTSKFNSYQEIVVENVDLYWGRQIVSAMNKDKNPSREWDLYLVSDDYKVNTSK